MPRYFINYGPASGDSTYRLNFRSVAQVYSEENLLHIHYM